MSHWRTMMPESKYLAAHNLNGKEVTVVIEKVRGEVIVGVDGKKDPRPVVYFKGAKLPLVCNATNGKVLAGLYGNDTDSWVGQSITIYPTQIKDRASGQMIDCLRLKAPRKQAQIETKQEKKEENNVQD